MTAKPHKLDTTDYLGARVIFTHKKWLEKSIQHAELCDSVFLAHVQQAISTPDEVWEDYSDPTGKRCHYKWFSATTYAKVVVWTRHAPHQVISAYETNRIKEKKYSPPLKRIK